MKVKEALFVEPDDLTPDPDYIGYERFNLLSTLKSSTSLMTNTEQLVAKTLITLMERHDNYQVKHSEEIPF